MSRLLVVTAVVFLVILVVDSKVRSLLTALLTVNDVGVGKREQREIPTWTGLDMVQGVLKAMNAQSNARGDAEERSTRSRASSFAISAAKKCLCVPPGFYGNKSVCPCYNNWKTKNGGPKCP
ncbi:hypothetical protein AAC387_Pa11g2280 [Persea americana]